MSTPAPWRCPDCHVWLAPHVTEHRCGPPDTMVKVTSIDPPGTGGGGSYAWTIPPGTTMTVT